MGTVDRRLDRTHNARGACDPAQLRRLAAQRHLRRSARLADNLGAAFLSRLLATRPRRAFAAFHRARRLAAHGGALLGPGRAGHAGESPRRRCTAWREGVAGRRGLVSSAASLSGISAKLPQSLRVEQRGVVALLFLARAHKRNALDDATVFGLEAFFSSLPEGIKAVVLAADGEHFCAGLDLGELAQLN